MDFLSVLYFWISMFRLFSSGISPVHLFFVLAGLASSLSLPCCCRAWWWSPPCLPFSSSAAPSKLPTGWAPSSADSQVTNSDRGTLTQHWLTDPFRMVHHISITPPPSLSAVSSSSHQKREPLEKLRRQSCNFYVFSRSFIWQQLNFPLIWHLSSLSSFEWLFYAPLYLEINSECSCVPHMVKVWKQIKIMMS